jgi:osmotically-inducible protein OsmY
LTVAQQTLVDRISERIHAQANLHVAVEETRDRIVLTGLVDSAEARAEAIEIAARLAPGKAIDGDGLEVMATLAAEDSTIDIPAAGNLGDTVIDVEPEEVKEALLPDFTTSPGESDVEPVIEDGDEPYFPPTDPVVTTDQQGNLEVIGGFSRTADEPQEPAPSAMDGRFGDEAIADAIRRELREDAATTDLRIEVTVLNGVAHLRGTVTDMDDAENAEAVTARVPGVVEVDEDLTVED